MSILSILKRETKEECEARQKKELEETMLSKCYYKHVTFQGITKWGTEEQINEWIKEERRVLEREKKRNEEKRIILRKLQLEEERKANPPDPKTTSPIQLAPCQIC